MPQILLDEKALTLEAVDPSCPDAAQMMGLLNQRLATLTGASGAAGFDATGWVAGRSVFLVARDERGQPVGCGALRPLAEAGGAPVGEIKRMYARWPGRGIGTALLHRLERDAWALGYRALWLETRRANAQACAFYRRHGYHDIPPYGRYVGRDDAICLSKRLQSMKEEDPSWT